MLEPVLLAGMQQGGQLMITTEVENYPGFADPIQGPWLMEQMQASRRACRHRDRQRPRHERRPRRAPVPHLKSDSGTEYRADALIIATGAKAKLARACRARSKYKGFGVSACATCDGFFYRGKDVIVVGGGNTAVEEALYLTHHASKVTVVHRRDSFRGERILQNRLFAHPKIEVVWNAVLDEVLGGGTPPGVTGVRLRDVRTGETKELKADGVFIAIGHSPAVEVFRDQLRMKPNGYIWTAPDSTATNIPGVFAAGDVTDEVFRQAVTAAGMGCMAALEAERWLAAVGETAEAAE
jgi:thioredoxin reductase (NADPH)